MGFTTTREPDGAWVLSGALNTVDFISEQTAGATLFYGTMKVELQLLDLDGMATSHAMTTHIYKAVRRGGFGRQNWAKEALALMLVEGAQEILARFNATRWSLPLHPRTAQLVDGLETADDNELYRLGLTGATDIAPRLLRLLSERRDADERFVVIEALARLRAEESIDLLGARYEEEDEDCRWATVKAMAYIGGDAAGALLERRALEDDYAGAKQLAEDVLKGL